MYTSHNDILNSHKFTMSEAIPLQKLLMGTPALRNHPGLILASSWSPSSWYHPVVAGACSGMEAIILALYLDGVTTREGLQNALAGAPRTKQ